MSHLNPLTAVSRTAGRLFLLCAVALLLNGAAAEERITPINADGLTTDIAAREGRVVLVSFWATWCRPCLDEIPALMALEDELGEQGFDLVAVSLDTPFDQETVIEPFMSKWFPEFSTYLSLENDMDSIVSVIDPYWNEILPTNYILDRDGSVAQRIQGGSTEEEFAAIIRPLLEQN